MKKYPKNLLIILIAEFFDQFSYWGLQSILVLYLTEKFLLDSNKAYLIYGTFSALTYVFTIVGGYIADKQLGFYCAVKVGAFFALTGNILLSLNISKLILLYFGLALIICGKALYMPNNANLLGFLYRQAGIKSEQGFSILYISTNLGSLLGPIFYGYITTYWHWQNSFMMSSVLYLIVQVILLFKKDGLNDKKILSFHNQTQVKPLVVLSKWPIIYLAFTLTIFLVLSYYLLQHIKVAGILLGIATCIVLLYLLFLALTKYAQQKYNILLLVIIIILCSVFFTFEFQIYSSLILFIKYYVNTKFLWWNVPIGATVAFESLAVILFSPCLALFWQYLAKHTPALSTRVMVGLVLEGICFFILAAMAYVVFIYHHVISIYPLLIANLFLGAGEVCVMPTTMAATVRLAPAGLTGFLMGTAFFSNAISGYLDGVIATFTKPNRLLHLSLPAQYSVIYFAIALICIAITGLAYLVTCTINSRFDTNESAK